MNYLVILSLLVVSCACQFKRGNFYNKQQSPINKADPFIDNSNYLPYLFYSYITESEMDPVLFDTKYYYTKEITNKYIRDLNQNAAKYNIGIICSDCYGVIDNFIKSSGNYFFNLKTSLYIYVYDDSGKMQHPEFKMDNFLLTHVSIEEKYKFIKKRIGSLNEKNILMAPTNFFSSFNIYFNLLNKYGNFAFTSDIPVDIYTTHEKYFLNFFILAPSSFRNFLYYEEYLKIELNKKTYHVYEKSFSFFNNIEGASEFPFLAQSSYIQKNVYFQNFDSQSIILIDETKRINQTITKMIHKFQSTSNLLYQTSNFPFDSAFLEYKIFHSTNLYRAFHNQHYNKYYSSNYTKDAILTTGVNFKKYEKSAYVFFSALNKYITPDTDVILFTDDDDLEYVRNYLANFKVLILPFWSYLHLNTHDLYINVDRVYQHSYRFVVYYEFLIKNPYRNIFFCDLTDTIIQDNPFSKITLKNDYFIFMNNLRNEIGQMIKEISLLILNNTIDYKFDYQNEEAFVKVLGVLGYETIVGKSKFCLGTVVADYSSALLLAQLITEVQERAGLIVFDNMILNYLANKWSSVFYLQQINNGMHYLFLRNNCNEVIIDDSNKLKKNEYTAFVIHNYDELLGDDESLNCARIFQDYLAKADLLHLFPEIGMKNESIANCSEEASTSDENQYFETNLKSKMDEDLEPQC